MNIISGFSQSNLKPVASLPMYDWPQVRPQLERLWARVAEALAAANIPAPAQLSHAEIAGNNWTDPGLVLSQTCGYPLVRELAAEGAAVLYYTSELEEVPLACDRVVVIFQGRVVDILDAREANEERLMRAAYGLTEGAA